MAHLAEKNSTGMDRHDPHPSMFLPCTFWALLSSHSWCCLGQPLGWVATLAELEPLPLEVCTQGQLPWQTCWAWTLQVFQLIAEETVRSADGAQGCLWQKLQRSSLKGPTLWVPSTDGTQVLAVGGPFSQYSRCLAGDHMPMCHQSAQTPLEEGC